MPALEMSPTSSVDIVRIFISDRIKEPDMELAQQFHNALKAAGHIVFMAGETIRLGENWVTRIEQELQGSDHLFQRAESWVGWFAIVRNGVAFVESKPIRQLQAF